MIRVLTVRENANVVNTELSDAHSLHFKGLFWKCKKMTQYFGKSLKWTQTIVQIVSGKNLFENNLTV